MKLHSLAISMGIAAGLNGANVFAQADVTTNQQSPTIMNTQPAPPSPDSNAASASLGTAASAPSLTFAKIDFTGMVDGYYSFNDNHPDSGFNQLYNFDDRANQWDLNLAKLTLNRDPAPIGFHVDVGFGRAFEIEKTPHPDPDFYRFIEQSYVSFKPKDWKGFEADFGEFVTSAGAEVIESKDNWNYSRSLLFSFAVPYYHFGIRTSMPIGSSLNVGVQVVNGWNAIVDDHGNNMQTVGLTGAVTRKKFTWSHNYYVGPQYTAVNNRNRNLYDTTLLLTPNDKLNAYLNFDYGMQHRAFVGSDHWIGFAGALHYNIGKHFAVSPRAEYYNDSTGFTTGTPQKLHEVTVTGEYKVLDGFLSRLEFRRDGSNEPFFPHASGPLLSKAQTTVTLGLIAYYPVKH